MNERCGAPLGALFGLVVTASVLVTYLIYTNLPNPKGTP